MTKDVSVNDAINSVKYMFIGIILIMIWLPSIIISEKNNKGNREETYALINALNNKEILKKIKNGSISSKDKKILNIDKTSELINKYRNSVGGKSESYPSDLLNYNVNIQLIKTTKEKEIKYTKNDDGSTETINWNNKSIPMNNWPIEDLPKQYSDAINKNNLNVKFNKLHCAKKTIICSKQYIM